MRAFLTVPSYGPVDPLCARTLRIAMMSAARGGTDWVGDISSDRMSFMDARNYSVQRLMEDPTIADGIMWVDSDMVPEAGSILRLLETATRKGYTFVSGVYHARRGNHRPVFFNYDPKTDIFKQALTYEIDTIKPEGGCGFGFVWTSTQLLLDIRALPDFDPDKGSYFPDHHFGNVSEDLGFCRLAHKAGHQLYVDTGVQVGHLGETEVITRDHHLRVLLATKGLTKVSVV